MSDVKKRRDLSLKQKIQILEQYDKLPKISQRNAAAQLSVSQPLLCKILKKRVEIEDAARKNDNLDTKRNRSGKDDEVESALKHWFTNIRKYDVRIDGPLLRQKAEEFAKTMGKEHFVATEGWFRRWKKRENVVYKRTHIKQVSENWIDSLWPYIVLEFTPNNIYNATETELYYQTIPDAYMFKTEDAKGCKASKVYVTILCCANMMGDKEKLLVIGNSKNPYCFTEVRSLPVDYYTNADVSMTSLIFNEWLLKWDNQLDRKIALLVDNCAAHSVNCELKNIKVIFLPTSTTSGIQPFHHGVIRILKAYYRRDMFARIWENMKDTQRISSNDLEKIMNFLDALHLIAMSWDQISKATVKNSFISSGFSKDEIEDENLNIQPLNMTAGEFEDWLMMDEETLKEEEVCNSETSTNATALVKIEEFVECEETETSQPPTNSEMIKALEVLRRGVQHRASDFQAHYKYEVFINNLLQEH